MPKNIVRNKIRQHLNKGDASTDETSRNESRFLYGMKKHLKKRFMFYDHPTSTCSFTIPETQTLDCERPASENACGANG